MTKYPKYIQVYLSNGFPEEYVDRLISHHKSIWHRLGQSVAYKFRQEIMNPNLVLFHGAVGPEPILKSFQWDASVYGSKFWFRVFINNFGI